MARKLAEAEALAPKVTPRKPAKAPPASTGKAKPAGATAAPKKPRAAKKPPLA
ncbi:hypothetical protein D3C77_804380 [compost metagenome]